MYLNMRIHPTYHNCNRTIEKKYVDGEYDEQTFVETKLVCQLILYW